MRRTFTLFGGSNGNPNSSRFRFRITQQNLLDLLIDTAHTVVEYGVYLMGPLLICLALGIIGLLCFTFFTIIVPMIYRKYTTITSNENYKIIPLWELYGILSFHIGFVTFVVFNILYNYAHCVLTKHDGTKFHEIIREFASACNIQYPETIQQIESYRRDYHSLLVLRLKRRNQNQQQQQQSNHHQPNQCHHEHCPSQQQQPQQLLSGTEATSNITHRTALVANSISPSNATVQIQQLQQQHPAVRQAAKKTSQIQQSQQQPPKVRQWMLLLPFEWGYCSITQQPKPPRSHYDNVAALLVLNLDHYCPWMFNSIGYFNYRYFVNFLIYIFVGMVYGACISLEPFMLSKSQLYRKQMSIQRTLLAQQHHNNNSNNNNHHDNLIQQLDRVHPMIPTRDEKMYITLSFMLCTAVGIAVALLGGFHIYLVVTAQTTIEFHSNFTNRKRAKAVGQKWKNPYSLQSWRFNWEQVYGKGSGSNIVSIIRSLLPSNRERDYFPAPVPGNPLRPSKIIIQHQQEQPPSSTITKSSTDNIVVNDDEEQQLLLRRRRTANEQNGVGTTANSGDVLLTPSSKTIIEL